MATIDELIIVPFDRADAMLRNAAHQHLLAGRLGYLPYVFTHDSAPEDLLLELCDRGLYLDELGHRRGPRRLLERLADQHHYPEAIVTLASQLYCDQTESTDSFTTFIERHRDSDWMLESLANLEPSSTAKADAFLSVARNHRDAKRILHMAELRRFESEAEAATEAAAIEQFFATKEPRVWRALAGNRSTPRHILKQLSSVTGAKNAADIRNRARENLARQ